MLLFNETITIDLSVHEDWLHWMRDTHIADIMATGLFVSYRLSRLLGHEHDDSEIYSLQLLVKHTAHLRQFNDQFAPELEKRLKSRFGGKYALFRTVMQVLESNEGLLEVY
jgi:Domain of unknown function (DUF4286)